MEQYGYHICGGSLIQETIVVTAAHCVDSEYVVRLLSVRVGTSIINSGGQIIKVRHVKVHEDWKIKGMINDIALIYLESKPQVQYAHPINLPTKNIIIPNKAEISVTGWGATQEGGAIAQILQEVIVPYVPLERCRYLYRHSTVEVTDVMMCAGVDGTGGKDACQGDSGGPAVYRGKLVGIVSWGRGCARALFPGVYTRIDKYLDWIKMNHN